MVDLANCVVHCPLIYCLSRRIICILQLPLLLGSADSVLLDLLSRLSIRALFSGFGDVATALSAFILSAVFGSSLSVLSDASEFVGFPTWGSIDSLEFVGFPNLYYWSVSRFRICLVDSFYSME